MPVAAAAAATPKPVTGEEAISLKLNAYTKGYNKLIGTFGLPQIQQRYLSENVPKRQATENFSITDGWVSIANDLPKKGREMKVAGLEELDKGAVSLITSLDTLVVQLNEPNIYYDSKAYKEDNLAKGKAADAGLRTAFEQSTEYMGQFNELLLREERKRTANILANLKASGDMLGYRTKLALQRTADALVPQLEKTLAEQRAAYASAKAKTPGTDSDYETAASSLVSLVGAYRTMKQSKSADDFNDMIKEYNRAVEAANDID